MKNEKELSDIASSLSGATDSEIYDRIRKVASMCYNVNALIFYFEPGGEIFHVDGNTIEEYSNSVVYVSIDGPIMSNCRRSDDGCEEYQEKIEGMSVVEVEQNHEEDTWEIKTDIPHMKFQVKKDDGTGISGIGVVLSIDNIPIEINETWLKLAFHRISYKEFTVDSFKEALELYLRHADLPKK